MHIYCSRDNLLSGIQVVQRAVSSKSTMPVLSGILLKAYNNRLYMSATDMDMGINISVPVQVVEEGSTVVQARILSELVRRLPDVPIELLLPSDTNSINVLYGSSKTSITCMEPDEFPIIPEIIEDGNTAISIPGALFKNMVRQTSFAAASDENRPIFTGVLVLIENDELKLVATDTHRLAYRKATLGLSINGNQQAVIPAKTLNEVSKLVSEDEEIISLVLTKTQVMFKTGETSLISRLIDGQFPNYKQVIPTSCKSKIRINTRKFLEAIERAALLAREGSNVIKINASGGLLIINASSPDIGRAHEEIEVEITGEDTQISFNSRFLIDELKVIDSEEIMIELSGALNSGVIRPMNNPNYIYLVLPIRTT